MLSPEELKTMHPRRKLRVYIPPTPLDITRYEQQEAALAQQNTTTTITSTSITSTTLAAQNSLSDSVFDDDAMFGEHDAMLGGDDDDDDDDLVFEETFLGDMDDIKITQGGGSSGDQPVIDASTSIKVSSLAWDADDTKLLSLFDPLVGGGGDATTRDVEAVAAALGRTVDGGKGGGKSSRGRGSTLQTKKYVWCGGGGVVVSCCFLVFFVPGGIVFKLTMHCDTPHSSHTIAHTIMHNLTCTQVKTNAHHIPPPPHIGQNPCAPPANPSSQSQRPTCGVE